MTHLSSVCMPEYLRHYSQYEFIINYTTNNNIISHDMMEYKQLQLH